MMNQGDNSGRNFVSFFHQEMFTLSMYHDDDINIRFLCKSYMAAEGKIFCI